ncbi:MAG: RHS repeat domain-containing protein, partial [Candidatus Dormibacteria bacterium]
LLVGDLPSSLLYKFGATGGTASSHQLSPGSVGSNLAGLAFSKSGQLYGALQGSGELVQLSPTTGQVLRVVVSGLSVPTGLAVDPLSGDLFVSGVGPIVRVSGFEGPGPVVVTPYGPTGVDGMTFAPNGTLFAVQSGQNILEIAGTNQPQPAAVSTIATVPTADGIALEAPPPGQPITKLVANGNDGIMTQVDFASNPPTNTPIITGGTRGDFVVTGPDGCLYATQTSLVEKVTGANGSCPFLATPTCAKNSTVPQVNLTIGGATTSYLDSGLALTAGGLDGETCGTNESKGWQLIAGPGGGPPVPVAPAVTLTMGPTGAISRVVGASQTFQIAAMNQGGKPVGDVRVDLAVGGSNAQTLTATTSSSGVATFTYQGEAAGSDQVQASAIVGGLRALSNAVTVNWTVLVPGGPTPFSRGSGPPFVSITSPANGTALTGSVSVDAVVNPPFGSTIASWSVTSQDVTTSTSTSVASGSGSPPLQVATLSPTGLAAGTYAITVAATSADGGSASAITHVVVAVAGNSGSGGAAQAAPTITSPSPANGSVVTAPTPLTATIVPPSGQSIASWRVSDQGSAGTVPVTLASGTGTPPATLATLDPTLLQNGTYAITISATASGGGTQTLATTVAIHGNLKLGRYVTTYQDLSIPVNGFQMSVDRTYDSTDKQVGAFGVGWQLSIANFRVTANGPLGAGGWTEYPTQCVFGFCDYAYKSSRPHYVTVTWPSGRQEVFNFTPQGGAALLYFQGTTAFTGRPGTGTTSTLQLVGDTSANYQFNGNLYNGSGQIIDPTEYVLTTQNGDKLVLSTQTGLVSETDPNGNSVTINASGIHASSGQSINFVRDSLGRITQITAPGGQSFTYTYDAAGNLTNVSYPTGGSDIYTYDANHDLLSAVGPGRPLFKQTYNAAGRLTSITDANGNTVSVSDNVSNLQQVFTGPGGSPVVVDSYD